MRLFWRGVALGRWYFRRYRHVVSMVLWGVRYGGPLESVLHGIIRQNMGATRHMFGRDYASVGDYYDTTQRLWARGLPGYGLNEPPHEADGRLKIKPVVLGEFAYCPVCGVYAYVGGYGDSPLCGHEVEHVSGSFLRGLILEGVRPPKTVMQPEVYDVVVKWWRVDGHPFVTERYLRRKEELEVL